MPVTAFEFVFALLAIVSSLGLTHLVAAFIALIRHAERVRWSAVHALWMWAALTLTIGN